MSASTEGTVCLGDAPARDKSVATMCIAAQRGRLATHTITYTLQVYLVHTNSSDTKTTRSLAFRIAYQTRYLPLAHERLRNHVDAGVARRATPEYYLVPQSLSGSRIQIATRSCTLQTGNNLMCEGISNTAPTSGAFAVPHHHIGAAQQCHGEG